MTSPFQTVERADQLCYTRHNKPGSPDRLLQIDIFALLIFNRIRETSQKDFDRITVKELCQKAGVNRTTFYLHYESMRELLEETVEMINERFKESLSAIPPGDPGKEVLTSEKYLRPYLRFIKENMRAYRVIHMQDHLFQSQKTFESFYQSVFSPALTHFGVSETEKKYVFAFYTQGTVAIIGKWLDDNCRDDVDMIVDLIARHTMAYGQERR